MRDKLNRPVVWTGHTGQTGCVAPRVILEHELCAYLLTKMVPALSK